MKAIFSFKNITLIGIILVSILGFQYLSKHKNSPVNISKLDLKDGDIIFKTSLSSQSQAIQLATDSKYSHCGLVFFHNNKWQVLEAIQPLKYTDFEKWIMRRRNSDLSHPAVKKKMRERYGKDLPLNEVVISPQAVFESDKLEVVD